MDNFIRADDNKIINKLYIRWVKKMDECLKICVKSDGCYNNGDTHMVCKINNLESYNKLNKYYE